MDADKWDAKDFSEADSQRLELIMTASTKDVESWAQDAILWADRPPATSTTLPNGVNNAVSKAKTRSAIIDDEKFMLPESAMTALAGVEPFARILTGIPNMSVDISTALLDYLKQFKSRSSQLVLGAGATRSAGLKNITTKHLAVSSQALSFIIAIIPYLREFARRYLPSSAGSVMAEFDKVKRSLQEQQVGLQDKFVEIMAGRATAHVTAMGQIDWDKANEEVNAYIATLVKETITLHKVLARYLPETNVGMIVGPVLASYREQLGQAFREAKVRTPVGKAR